MFQVLDYFGHMHIIMFSKSFFYELQSGLLEKIVWMAWSDCQVRIFYYFWMVFNSLPPILTFILFITKHSFISDNFRKQRCRKPKTVWRKKVLWWSWQGMESLTVEVSLLEFSGRICQVLLTFANPHSLTCRFLYIDDIVLIVHHFGTNPWD